MSDANTWQQKYKELIVTAEEAVQRIKPGHRVFIGTGCAQPETLVAAMVANAANLADTEIIHSLTLGQAPYADPALARNFRVNSFFISDNVRPAIQEGLGDYTPISQSDVPRLFCSGRLPLDVALVQVSPPDDKGMCSLGISVDIVKSAIANARRVIAEVNPQMPRTHGASTVNIYDFDLLVPVDLPLIEYTAPKPTEVHQKIGEYVAALVDDGATIGFGIGTITASVISFLKTKKHLGIHTEMFTDAMIDLVESGAIDGRHKSRDRGKIVTSFCVGTQKLYDYIDNNPLFAFHPTEYVNDPLVIGSQHKQVSINSALKVDLTGQICADSLGTSFYSGIGGQTDFIRGAARSIDGKAIIALPSTAQNGTVSRIVPILDDGAGVVTTRGDVHYVVTEYGVAYLHGKSVEARAIALISIAHPDFRAELMRQAVTHRYVRPDYAGIESKILVGPPEYKTSHLLGDGTMLTFRPMHPTDESRLNELFYALSKKSIYHRFMSKIRFLQRKEIQNLVFVNHRTDVAIVATVPESYGEDIVAIGRYYLDQKTNMAELSFVVRDAWQNRGIGSALFRHLSIIAKRNGIAGFTAELTQDNLPMQRILNNGANDVSYKANENVFSFVIRFT